MTSEGQLMLGGSMSFWGPGVASADGKTISFKWARGALVWEVTYERSEKQAELAQAR
jgi:hypothetical protein